MSTSVDPLAWAAHWSQRWFLDPQGRDRLTFGDEIEGGWAFHVEAFEALLRFATTRLQGESPASRSPAAMAKRHGLDRAIRSWGLRLLDRLAAQVPPARVVVIGEVPTPSMTEPLIAASRQIDSATLVAGDPRVMRRFRASGLVPHALLLPLREERRLRREAGLEIRALLDALRRDPPQIPLDGRDVGREVVANLEPVIRRSLPWAAAERAAVERTLADSGADTVVLASDQHRIGRVTVDAARRRGVRSIVTQHGLPRIPIGLVPIVADAVAAWSDESVSWFASHGSHHERLVVTGNPRLDGVSAFDREAAQKSVRQSLGLNGSTRVLVALSPDGGRANPLLVDAAITMVERTPDASCIIKLHPGQGEWSWVEPRIRRSAARDRIRVCRAEPLPELLGWAQLTLLHRTTVGVESLVYGTPIAVLELPGMVSGADAELAPLSPDVVTSSTELGRLTERLRSEEARRGYLSSRQGAIESVVGPLDGHAAERIARLTEAAITPREAERTS